MSINKGTDHKSTLHELSKSLYETHPVHHSRASLPDLERLHDTTTEIRRSDRDRKPTWKLQENIEQEHHLFDEFWYAVKKAGQVIRDTDMDLDITHLSKQKDLPTINRKLKESMEDLDIAYDAIRKTLRGTIPQDVRRYMDRYKADFESLIQRTTIDEVEGSLYSGQSRSSSTTSSKKILLAARAATLQVEIEAKGEENQRKLELKRLESELEAKRQQIEDQRMITELKKTKVELQILESEDKDADDVYRFKLPPSRPTINDNHLNKSLNVAASPFFPQPHISTTPGDASLNNLMKTFSDSLNLSRLPVPEPPDFDGDPLQYPAWKSSFSALIESRQIPSTERIYYMKQYLKGEAREAVEALFYFNTESAYNDARAILEERYGNSFIVSEAFRNKLDAWPKLGGGDYKGLRRLSDFLRQCRTAMTHIDDLRILNDCRENRKILEKLPDWLARRWGRIVANEKTYPNFCRFVDFLTREADIVCNPITSLGQKPIEPRKPKRGPSANTFMSDMHTSEPTADTSSVTENSTTTMTDTRTGNCIHCEKTGHSIYRCQLFCSKTPRERNHFIMKKGLCHGCLRSGHMVKECKKKSICERCKGKHPTCIHGDYEALHPSLKTTTQKDEDNVTRNEPATVHRATQPESNDLRCSMTVPVYISTEDEPSKETLIYALLDTQSDTTFITDETTKRLNAQAEPTRLKISTMTSSTVVDSMKVRGLRIRGINSKQTISLPMTYTRSYIPMNRSHIPTPEVARRWPHLRNLEDKIMPLQDCDVGLLIGYNCPQAMAPLNAKLGEADDPFGVETKLGWSIVGIIQGTDDDEEHISHRSKVQEEMILPKIVRILESDFIETKTDQDVGTLSQNDLRFSKIIQEGIHQNDEGFYEMPLPFKYERPSLPNNLRMAEKRLDHLKRRFVRDPKYFADYKRFMTDMLSRGDAEEAPVENNKGTVWYIPHHGVYHPKKPDKIRVVFDGSARYKDTSLNDHLLPGPDLINSLVGVLCRFREKPIAVMGDIESMFHRFKVNPEDRNYLQFLWWKDGDYLKNEPTIYRMTVHLFGATSSPGCANYGLKKLARDNENEFGPEATEYLMNDFYVDDGLRSCDTVEEAIQLVEDAREICSRGNLRLHKLISNNRNVMKSIPESEQAKEMKTRDINFDDLPIERPLGMQWCVESDSFQFRITINEKPRTRRGILATVASVFDPLGCLSPFILIGKQILQQMCRENAAWDEFLSDELMPKWDRWMIDLPKLAAIQISRCLVPEDFGTIVHRELHHFSDASFSGYGQCSYLRVVNDKNQVHCALVMAKSRVTPLKIITIPRLELTAAVVAIKISKILKAELRQQHEHHFWTDSQIVLGYINSDARKFRIYVANRIQMIRSSSEVHQWRYVKSEENPADHASRGLNAEHLKSSNWFTGPAFLWKPNLCTTPLSRIEIPPEDPEVKPVTVKITETTQNKTILERLVKFSDWNRAVLAITALLKLISRKKKGPIGDLKTNIENIVQSEKLIIKWIQEAAFRKEIDALRKDQHYELTKGNQLHKLNPFVDDQGILRVGGRLKRSSLAYDTKHPVILPNPSSDGHIVRLIIKHYHQKVKHQGRGFTINELRANGFWVLGCSRAVSSLIFKCVECRKLRGSCQTQKMADLPQERLEPSAPFTYCGIDCFGPFQVKEGRKSIKRYGLLFTCMASRAIHIETLDDMSTDAFINGLRCFIALRGPVRTLRCDQGSNFVGAANELKRALKEIKEESIRNFLAANHCDFVMNTPASSHMGGVWERQIRTTRSVLSAILLQHGSRIDTSSLRTFLYEAMAIVNSRPLTTRDINDPTGPEPLTPNHLLTMKSKVIVPPPGNFSREDIFARKRWRRVQHLANEFWSRWKNEYLQNLQQRQKWIKQKRNVAVGDIVILKDEDLVRAHWRLARVTKAFHDDDGLVRKVEVQIGDPSLSKSGKRLTKATILERPIHKLTVLLESTQEDAQ